MLTPQTVQRYHLYLYFDESLLTVSKQHQAWSNVLPGGADSTNWRSIIGVATAAKNEGQTIYPSLIN